MVILSYVGVFIAGAVFGFITLALLVGSNNSTYSVEEYQREEDPDEQE